MEENRNRRKNRHRRPGWVMAVLMVLFVVLVSALVTFGVLNGLPFSVELAGNAEMILEFGESFSDPGASAVLNGAGSDAQITTEGQIIPEQLGTYTITYRTKWLWRTAEAVRTVRIVDTTAPTIVLKHTDSVTLPGSEYVEEGFVAEDNYDGDITHLVQRIVENDTVYYQVADSSGNTTTVTRTIVYGDYTPPELTLLGEATVTISAGGRFSDPGYTAVDNLDGDITDQVEVTGDYDIYTPGTYTIRYKVTDSYGNVSEAARTLVVEKITQPDVVDPGDKIIYLTFDDGPGQHTPRLLEILAKYNVKATFFVVGTSAVGYLDDIVAGGHSIALHSGTHNFSQIYASEEAFMEDLTGLRQKVYDYTGVDTTLIRFPGGTSNTVSKNYCVGIMTRLTQVVTAQGYQYFDWNVDSNDAGGAKTADEVFNNVISGVQKHNISIVLQHDIHGYSVDAVERIIQWGLANGYTFLALNSSSPPVHHSPNN